MAGLLAETLCTLLYSSVHWTNHVLQGTRNKWPCITGHPVHGSTSPKIIYRVPLQKRTTTSTYRPSFYHFYNEKKERKKEAHYPLFILSYFSRNFVMML